MELSSRLAFDSDWMESLCPPGARTTNARTPNHLQRQCALGGKSFSMASRSWIAWGWQSSSSMSPGVWTCDLSFSLCKVIPNLTSAKVTTSLLSSHFPVDSSPFLSGGPGARFASFHSLMTSSILATNLSHSDAVVKSVISNTSDSSSPPSAIVVRTELWDSSGWRSEVTNMAADPEFQPGAAPFGNFINYYSFNPPENRLKLLPKEFYTIIRRNCKDKPLIGLDIGCNTGDLTAALVEQFSSDSPGNSQPDHKDSTLTASQTNQHTDFNTITSQCNQHTDITVTTITSQPTQHTDFNTTASQPTQHTDFHMLGCDIDNILIQRATENHRHTDHLTFQTLDYMDTEQKRESLGAYLQRFGRAKFDVTFCFSVTMWIHLQNGDSGLRDFLRSVSSNTWFLLLEPQPWKCYRSAARRLRKLGRAEFPQLQELQIRSNVETEIDRCLTQDCAMRRAGGFGETQWGRKLVLYYSGEGELL